MSRSQTNDRDPVELLRNPDASGGDGQSDTEKAIELLRNPDAGRDRPESRRQRRREQQGQGDSGARSVLRATRRLGAGFNEELARIAGAPIDLTEQLLDLAGVPDVIVSGEGVAVEPAGSSTATATGAIQRGSQALGIPAESRGTAGRIGEELAGGIALAAPFFRTAQSVRAASSASPVIREIARRPGRATAEEVAGAAGAGALASGGGTPDEDSLAAALQRGGQSLGIETSDEGAATTSRGLRQIAGGLLGTSALNTTTNLSQSAARQAAPLVSQRAARREAGRRLRNVATQPGAVAADTATPRRPEFDRPPRADEDVVPADEPIPGLRLTPAQISQDPGLLSAERTLARQNQDFGDAIIQQRQAANQVATEEVENLAPGDETAQAFVEFIQGRVDRLDDLSRRNAERALERAQARVRNLQSEVSDEELERVFREELETARRAGEDEVRAAFDQIPRVNRSTRPIQEEVATIEAAQLPDEPPDKPLVTSHERNLFGLGDEEPVQSIQRFRSRILDQIRQEASGDTVDRRRLSSLQRIQDAALDAMAGADAPTRAGRQGTLGVERQPSRGPRQADTVTERSQPAPTAPTQQTPRPSARQPVRDPERLATFIQRQGGVRDEGGEVSTAIGGPRARPGVINNRSGLSLDEARRQAEEEGFIGFADDFQQTDTDDFVEALNQDVRGQPVVRDRDVGARLDAEQARLANEDRADLEQAARDAGVDDARIDNASNRELERFVEDAQTQRQARNTVSGEEPSATPRTDEEAEPDILEPDTPLDEQIPPVDIEDPTRAARDLARRQNERFNRGPIGRILGFDVQGGQRTSDARTLSALLAQTDTAQARDAIFAAVGGRDRAMDAVRDTLRQRFADQVGINTSGDVNTRAARTFLQNNRRLLRGFPELQREFTDAAGLRDAAARAGRRSERVARRLGRRRGDRIPGSQADRARATLFLNREPEQAVRSIFSGSDNVAQAQSLVRSARRDDTGRALRGLQRAVVETLFTPRGRLSIVDNTGDQLTGRNRINSGAVNKIVKDRTTRQALGEILGEQGVRRLQRIANVTQALQASETARPGRGSDTAENLLRTPLAAGLRFALSVGGAATGRQLSSTVQVPGRFGGAGATIADVLPTRRESDIKRLMEEALLDPVVFRDLTRRVTDENVGSLRQRLRAHLGNIETPLESEQPPQDEREQPQEPPNGSRGSRQGQRRQPSRSRRERGLRLLNPN